MNILILGAAGFIGTNLTIEYAKDKGNRVTVIDQKREYFAPLLAKNLSNVNFVACDEMDVDSLKFYLHGRDVVFHLISTIIPTNSNQQIAGELSANVVFTAKLLDACVRAGVKKVVFISSGGTVYGKEDACPIGEDAPTHPITSYGISKLTIEKLLYLYWYMHGLDYRVIRLANPYGPYQRPNGKLGAVTTFVYKAITGAPITVYGDGSVVRDFIYIDDVMRAIKGITESESPYRLFNLGSGYGTSIKGVLDIIQSSLNIPLNITYTEGRSVDVPVNYLDISRYETCFGPLNPIPLSEGVRYTAQFLEKEYERRDLCG